jgi:hypothetical protein
LLLEPFQARGCVEDWFVFKACAGDDSVGVGLWGVWRTVQRESVRDSLFESGGLFFGIPFAVVVHAFVLGDDFPVDAATAAYFNASFFYGSGQIMINISGRSC